MTVAVASTPQRINGRRRIVRPKARRLHVQAEVAQLHAAHAVARATLAGPAPTCAGALAAGKTQLGLPYGITGCRCSLGHCYRRDCSGEVIFAVNSEFARVGVAQFPCTSSFAIARFCRDHDRLISMEQAIHTPGSIGVRNPWGDPNSNGSNGHVWLNEGDGQHTVEEGGHATGCYVGSVFTKAPHGETLAWMLFPGLAAVAPSRRGDGEMILQTLPNGKPKPSPIDGRHAGHFVSADGTYVVGVNGGSIDGDSGSEADGRLVRRWHPMPVASGQFLSIARRANNTGLIATRNDGVEVSGDYS